MWTGAVVTFGGMFISNAFGFGEGVMPVAAIIVEYLILKPKINSFKEKFILLIINPVLHFCILLIAVGIYMSNEIDY